MATFTNETKNSAITATNESRTGTGLTWEEAIYTWDESYPSTWANQRLPFLRETKNSTSFSNETKT